MFFADAPSPFATRAPIRIHGDPTRIPSPFTPSPLFRTPELQKPKLLGTEDNDSDEGSTESGRSPQTLGARRREARHPTADAARGFAVVTSVPVDASYKFPRTELAAMSDNIAQLIQDIDQLDGHRWNMMEELKVLRDITFFYHERHPELRSAGTTATTEDKPAGSTRQHDTADTKANLANDASEARQEDLKDTPKDTKK